MKSMINKVSARENIKEFMNRNLGFEYIDGVIWEGGGENLDLWYGSRKAILNPIVRTEYAIRPMIRAELYVQR